ncbi:sodium ABC transporter ATP-binding protein [Aequoribacter fuscus]|jgi:sodium transport system ATP-binding protein|uniref:Sodium ABC transporter ATP-binding protein n=1 Tax=Aequoribacter fuscus TaxID=2518989 RepID=F3L3V3_9GAMM|nr:ATP-binding cassette domain-containing protein [Aequoribacter fuscus]EGG29002.1 sodium ABC transporter ATP-binding protein [Aequoribacter fuscus]QHJ88153.1 ATP-binding cassette domain-containing protein [Aequoribacter fuscus]
MIEINKVAKSFASKKGTIEAVKSVSLTARDGQITGLLGPNGAGKTTTMRLLYGLLKPSRGSVRVDGVDIQEDKIGVRRRLGVLPDTRGLYPRLTARENVAYFAELNGLRPSDYEPELERLIDSLDMADFIDRRCEGFSQGQRTKTAIARSVIHRPQNIVLDEPTNGLDVMTTRGLRRFLLNCKAEGRCVVLSTHIMQEVAALCDHVVVIAKGEVMAQGSPESLKEQAQRDSLEDAFVHLIGSEEGLML